MQVTRVAPDRPVPSLMHRRRVMADRITYVGLDVHKESIVVAVAEGGLRGEVREYGRIANTATALDRLLRKLGSDGMTLRFCYEAGPCGYGIHRQTVVDVVLGTGQLEGVSPERLAAPQSEFDVRRFQIPVEARS